MYDSHIVVTANPSYWEGDFRLWEALSTGSLVFVDEMKVPTPYPLIHNDTIIYFSVFNKPDFYDKLDYYLRERELSRVIARRGYEHALKYHRTVNTVDYILRSAHVKLLTVANDSGQRRSELLQRNGDDQQGICLRYHECAQLLVANIKRNI
jgi:hypothetical protein